MAEGHDGGSPPSTWLAAGWAILTMAFAAALRYWPQRRREAKKQDADIVGDYLESAEKIREHYERIVARQDARIERMEKEIEALKVSQTEQAARHLIELGNMRASHMSELEKRDVNYARLTAMYQEILAKYEGE